jgi:hypothetical protein
MSVRGYGDQTIVVNIYFVAGPVCCLAKGFTAGWLRVKLSRFVNELIAEDTSGLSREKTLAAQIDEPTSQNRDVGHPSQLRY